MNYHLKVQLGFHLTARCKPKQCHLTVHRPPLNFHLEAHPQRGTGQPKTK